MIIPVRDVPHPSSTSSSFFPCELVCRLVFLLLSSPCNLIKSRSFSLMGDPSPSHPSREGIHWEMGLEMGVVYTKHEERRTPRICLEKTWLERFVFLFSLSRDDALLSRNEWLVGYKGDAIERWKDKKQTERDKKRKLDCSLIFDVSSLLFCENDFPVESPFAPNDWLHDVSFHISERLDRILLPDTMMYDQS